MFGLFRDGVGSTTWLLALAAVLSSGPLWGASRVALVVGNGGYAQPNIPALANPVNDARLMAEALETSGFEVRLVTDADQAAMKAAIEAFGEQLERAGAEAVGLFYYAGHGVEVRGQNYLIPIGAEIAREVEFKIDAVPVDWVLSWMEAMGNRLNLVILDACRNNPYGGGSRGASQGLAQMDAPSGSLIAYSAAPGQVAADGEGKNSPYTAALAKELVEPGLKVEDMFKRVRVAVEATTNGEQTPWESSSLRGDFYFVAKAEAPPVPEPVTVTVTETVSSELTVEQLAARAYEAAERLHTVSSYGLVIERFPNTLYAQLAQQQLEKLASAVTPPAPSAAEAETALGLTRAQRRLVQRGLAALEFDVGVADGIFGPRTRAGLAQWQTAQGAPATGYLNAEAAATLLAAGEAAPPPEPRTRVVQGALNTLVEALSIARGITEADKRAGALSSIAGAQARAGDVPGALATARGITETDERAWALRFIAGAQAKAGDVPGALATARGITEAGTRVWVLRFIAGAQAKAGDVPGAQRSIAEAQTAARGIIEAGDRARALSVIAGAQAEAGDVPGAQRSFAEAQTTARGITEKWQRAWALGAIAEAQARAGDAPGAFATARGIIEAGDRARALRDIAGAQAEAGDVPGALATARGITEADKRAVALRDIAGAQAEAGDVPGALATARGITEADEHAWALTAIAEAQARAGDVPGALATARGIIDESWRAWALGDIAEAQARAGDVPGALATARGITEAYTRAWVLSDIAEAQVEAAHSP